MSNYKDWIDAVDIKIDYFSAFMKAWIAFNSWYESGEIPGKTDRDHIEYIAEHTNRFKTYVMNLINVDNSEGISYRDSIANLHESLLGAAITTQEYIGVRQTVSFAEIASKNANAHSKFDYYFNSYECTRSRGKITTCVSVKRSGRKVFEFEQDEYKKDELQAQSDFMALSITQKEKCLSCYENLRPYICESILDTSEDAKKIGQYGFVNDADKISKAIVIILYMLRCCLAHGDISPDESANKVYKYAYEVLTTPLKKLR